MAMEAPNESEIESRLRRAIAPALTRSSLRDSITPPLHPPPGSSSLSDLLVLLSPADTPLCPHCRSPLPFGTHSQLCLVCSSLLHQLPPPSFATSVPFRRLLHALQIDGLEADFQDSEEEKPHVSQEVFVEKKYAASESTPGCDKTFLSLNNSEKRSEFAEDSINPILLTTNTQVTADAVTSIATIMVKHGEKSPNILEYAANFDGVLLEDFFNNPAISGAAHIQESNTDTDKSSEKGNVFSDAFTASMGGDTNNVFPNIQDTTNTITASMGANTDNLFPYIQDTANNIDSSNSSSEILAFAEEEDAFSSWEGVFQSATPLGIKVTGAPWFETQLSSSNGDVKGQLENSLKAIALDNEDDEWASNWVGATPGGNEDIFTLKDNASPFSGNGRATSDDFFFPSVDIQAEDLNTLSSSSMRSSSVIQSNVDVDDFFGSSWQGSSDTLVSSAVQSESRISSAVFNNDLTFEMDEGKSLHPAIVAKGIAVADSSYDSAVMDDKLEQQKASECGEVSSKDVGSLLTQLHDLSFMLSDTLVSKSEGDFWQDSFENRT